MSDGMISLLSVATCQTIYMVLISGAIAIVGGLPLGITLFTTSQHGILENVVTHRTFGFFTNVLRAIPFIILLVAIIPLTRLIVGTSIGTTAAIVPLSIAAIPFFARIVENALLEVNSGLIEAGHAMGASPLQIISKILIPEALPGIINGITVMLITLVGYSAMAGTVGGGGLGSVAINYGYQRFDPQIMLATVLVLIVIVYAIQYSGDFLSKHFSH